MADTSNTSNEEIIVHGIYTYKLNAVDDEGKKKYAVVYFESAINDVRLTGFKKIDNPDDIPDIDYEKDTLDKMLQALEARISFPKTFGPASSSAAGSIGAVPAPAKGDQKKYLRADGTWQTTPGIVKLNGMTPDANGQLTIKVSQIENDARDSHGNIVGYALTTDIPSKVSDLTNDVGYITGVAWGDIKNVPTSFTPASHNQASNTINKMTGYAKPSSTSAIATTDTLNGAIGKLEKALDGKQASGNYALITDIPTVWDSDGHLVSPAGWKLWITDSGSSSSNSGN